MLDSYAFIYQQYSVDLFSKVLFLERVFFSNLQPYLPTSAVYREQ